MNACVMWRDLAMEHMHVHVSTSVYTHALSQGGRGEGREGGGGHGHSFSHLCLMREHTYTRLLASGLIIIFTTRS